MKIELVQSLYQKYSKLHLSFESDRPIAIRGLERRLIRTLKTIGGYGVLSCYLHRCLLWQRSGNSLRRIKAQRSEPIPSWSWMAYMGEIEYMKIPFGKVLWDDSISLPFGTSNPSIDGQRESVPPEVEAKAWDIADLPGQSLVFDEPKRTLTGALKCVIVGANKEQEVDPHQIHYTLILSKSLHGKCNMYERVGVGFLERRNIKLDRPAEVIRIQ